MKSSCTIILLVLISITIFSCSKTEEVTVLPEPESSDYAFIKTEIQEFGKWVEDVSAENIQALNLEFELVVPDQEFCPQDCGDVPPEYQPYATAENINKINQLASLLGFEDAHDLFLHVSDIGKSVNSLYFKFQPVNRGTFLEELVESSFSELADMGFNELDAIPVFRNFLKSAYGDFTQHASFGNISLEDYLGAHSILYGNGSAAEEVFETLEILREISLGN